MVWQWAATDRASMYDEQVDDAIALARTLGRSTMNELDDANWKQISNNASLILKDNPKVAYVIIHGDDRANRRIVSAAPKYIRGAIPDVVPLKVTQDALAVGT